MHIHLGFLTPLLWCAIAFVAIQLRHRRKMERLRLGLPDRREEKMERWRAWGQEMRERHHPSFAQPAPEQSSADRRELEALRERVKVLERIATDDRKTHDLAQEIEALRDR
jgi:hypothetical protein